MIKIGLTGGIASGKSMVSRWLIAHGYPVIDADRVSREVVTPGEKGLDLIVRHFGKGMLLPSGALDRKRLGALIFQDDKKRKLLNELLHPLIRSRMFQQLDELEKRREPIVFLDIPLLYESGLETWTDKTLVVYVTPEEQLKRLMKRNGLAEEQARDRINAQMSLEAKAKRADAIIDNNGSVKKTEEQIRALFCNGLFDC
ncbi:dephospho-CoA kinase [Sporolactobacillus terrae]|uniref:Dephospho-CoA kinase n=1 Tax=Sporolactobacillus terrae TaxID=269673 RepID=A0A5K7X0A6_9BACL|nr:dephospho-CoA kinase [Sporolactobacillus terrae]BBN99409.1 dephospho-CoA kinase [Sporolactobacillus terrae]